MAKSGKKLGLYLRDWREHRGLSLEAAAYAVADLAEKRGVPKEMKKVPRTHASLSRVENGLSGYSEVALELLAEVYDCHPLALISRKPTDSPGLWEIYDELTNDRRQEAEKYLRFLRDNAA